MSSKQDLIELKEVISQCNELIKQQSQGWAKIVEEIKKVNSSAPSSYIKMQKEVAKSVIDAEKAEQQYQKTLQQKQVLEQKILDTERKKIQLAETARRANEAQAKALQRATQTALNNSSAYLKLQTNWRNAQRAYADLLSTVNASPQAIAKARNEFEQLDKKIKQVDQATKNYSKNVGNYASGLKNLTSDLAGALGWAGAIGVSITLLKDAFDSVVKFDAGLVNVGKTTGLAGKELKKLGTEIRNLSNDLGVVSANKLTEYASVAGQLGVKGSENILKFTKALAMLETATNISGQEGGAEIARLLTLVDGGVQNVEKFGDEIVKLGNNFAATESEILGNSTAIAQNTGVYKLGRQTVLAYGVATKAVGIEAEITGSTIGRVLAEIEKSIRTGENIDTLAKLTRKSVSDLKNEFKTDPGGVLYSFVEGLNAVDKSGGSVLGTLDNLGITAVRDKRVIASLATGGYDVLTQALKDVASASGSMEEEFKTASEKIESNINRVKVSWENLILDINGSENAIGSLANKWLIGLSIIIDKIREVTTSVRELRRQAGEKIEQTVFSETRENFASYNTSKDTRELASNQFKQLKEEEKKILDDIAKNRKIIEDWNKEKLMPSFLYFGLDKSKDANDNIDKLSQDLAVVQGTMKGINSLAEDYNSLRNKTKTDILITGTDDSSKGVKTDSLERERIRRLVDIAKQEQATAEATIKRQIEEAKFANDKNLQYTLEQQLSLVTYQYKERIAELEIKDAEQLKNRKIELAEEFSAEIIKINQTEGKEVDKQYEEDLKDYQRYLDIRLKAKQDALDKEEQDELNAIQKRMDERQKRYETASQYGMDFSFGSFGFSSLDVLKDLDTFVLAWDEGLMSIEEKTAVVMKAIASVMSDTLNMINALQQANFEAQLQRLEAEKEVALKFAGDSATGRDEIEKQADEKKKKLQIDNFKREKKMAILQANINIASAILSALATQPVWVGIAMSALVGILGAVQLATISSTPLPAFWTGTQDAPEGLALTQEKGAEMITDKNGKIKTLGNNKGAQLTYLNKGDKVYNASDTTDKINEMLLSSGISPIVKVENKGLTKEEMIDVMNQTLARQPRQTTKFDEKGVTLFIEKENSRTIKRGNNARI